MALRHPNPNWHTGGWLLWGECFPVDNPTKKRFQWDRVSWLKQRLVRIGVIDVVKVSKLETLCFFFLLHEFCVKTYRRNLEISKQSKFGFHDFWKNMFGGKNVMWGTIEICVLSNNMHQEDDRPLFTMLWWYNEEFQRPPSIPRKGPKSLSCMEHSPDGVQHEASTHKMQPQKSTNKGTPIEVDPSKESIGDFQHSWTCVEDTFYILQW